MDFKLLSSIVLALVSVAAFGQQPKSEADSFVDGLMAKMTLEEKIGQLNLPNSSSFVAGISQGAGTKSMEERIADGELGGLFGLKGAASIRKLQETAVEKSRLHIPMLFGLDVIHGYDITFPIPLALSSSWNMDLIERMARISATEASSDGVCWVFSPMVDISHDARWGRVAEGAGEDPYLGARVARAYVKGYQTDNELTAYDNVMACVKHYALYGAAEAGRDYNTVDMSRQKIMNEYMAPYKAAADQGAGSFMASFNEFEGIPATANRYLLDEVLRKQWGFDGFIVTDYTGIMEMVNHGIGDQREVTARAINAGIDMDMVSGFFIDYLKDCIDSGAVGIETVNQACRRVLLAKYRLGLFEDPYRYCNEERSKATLGNPDNLKESRRIAGECQVLLKNEGNLLPLRKDMKIALVGPLADRADDMVGSWAGSSRTFKPVSLLEGLKDAVGSKGSVSYAEGSWLLKDYATEEKIAGGFMGFVIPGMKVPPVHARTEKELLEEALNVAKDADVIVAALGENANMSGEGTSRSIPDIPEPQENLLKALVATGKPVVLVLFTGRPLTLAWEDENVGAILNAWFPGLQAGNAIADVLFGDVNPSARLTVSFPRNAGQIPIYYNHKNTGRPQKSDTSSYVRFKSDYIDVVNAPLYPFGYGLSYTTYSYSDVKLSSCIMPMDGKVTASVTVTNSGSRDGKETVQLYIHDVFSQSTRPVKELRGFKKVDLKKGESMEVTFDISAEDLKYYNHELQYVCEPGDFEIMIGPNSRDLKKAVLTVLATSQSQSNNTENMNEKKVLVAYFSCTGTTAALAGTLAKAVNGDLYEITPDKPYTSADLDWTDKNSRSTIEMSDKASRPAIKGKCDRMDRYDVVYVGFPIWWGIAPTIVNTFLESYDFSGKTVIPFCTSGGSGVGQSEKYLQPSCSPQTLWRPGKLFRSSASVSELADWAKSLKL